VNGIDSRTLPLEKLRDRLGLVLQDIILFPGTVLDNLRLENSDINEQQVIRALETVKATDLIDRSESGLNETIAEHGSNLSMGERQLLSFARALVFNPEILVLDEATSSVDPLTEQRVQDAVETLLKGRTALIIAHRLQTILECDEIMVVHNGQIEERGTHEELMALEGFYYKLYQIQFGAGALGS
jgi:ATP-binding cassette subfamily B protein